MLASKNFSLVEDAPIISASVSVDYLVVAGGGGGGNSTNSGGGGGAGGFRTDTGVSLNTNTVYQITVGAGAAQGDPGSNGSNSVFQSITSTGGGGAGANDSAGQNGGSGGGGSYYTGAGLGNTPSTSPSQGNNGAQGRFDVTKREYTSGGGGGAGAAAVQRPDSSQTASDGGAGTASSITGSSVTYAGGGGAGHALFSGGTGGAWYAGGAGGAGGGGQGGGNGTVSTAGSANTGGGGGGAGGQFDTSPTTFYAGQPGGSGIVIIKIPNTNTALFTPGVVFTMSTAVAGFKVYSVTAAGPTDSVLFA